MRIEYIAFSQTLKYDYPTLDGQIGLPPVFKGTTYPVLLSFFNDRKQGCKCERVASKNTVSAITQKFMDPFLDKYSAHFMIDNRGQRYGGFSCCVENFLLGQTKPWNKQIFC
jgi:hypothetical protein